MAPTAELATAVVTEVDFEPDSTTRALLDELAARELPLAIIADAWPSTLTRSRGPG